MRTLLCSLFLVMGVAVAGDDDDPVKAKLEKAKDAYKSAREKNKEFLIDWLTKQEESARKAGKREQVGAATPKGFDNIAQGCRRAATLGQEERWSLAQNPERVSATRRWTDATPSGEVDVFVTGHPG